MEQKYHKLDLRVGYEQMDVKAIHHFLSQHSYWAKGIPFDMVKTSLAHSFCLGFFDNAKQVSFARLVTDYATFAYLCDVYVLPEYRGCGLSKKMMQHIIKLDFVQRLRRVMLATRDAHGLYVQFSFKAPAHPEVYMAIERGYDVYEEKTAN